MNLRSVTELHDNLVRGSEFALEPVDRKELRIINSPMLDFALAEILLERPELCPE